MKLKKTLLIEFVIFAMALLFLSTSFSQGKSRETIKFSGVIENIQKDFEFIVVNEMRIFLSSNTKILDDRGDILKANDLKLKMNVTIEALRNPKGLLAKKIVVKTSEKP